MSRRTLLTRVLAVAGMAALAPSAAQASETPHDELLRAVFADDEADAYARGYLRGRDVAAARGESRAQDTATCADCERMFGEAFVLPEMYAKAAPEVVALTRSATHQMALRDGISHDEAALIVYWQGFPTYKVVSIPEGAAWESAPDWDAPDDLASSRYSRSLHDLT